VFRRGYGYKLLLTRKAVKRKNGGEMALKTGHDE
jgi:hypothetical protein